MKKQIYEIDSEGFISEVYVGEFNEKGKLIEPTGDFITIDLPQPLHFYKPRWSDTEWIEGATKEEIDELTKVEPSPPSSEERINALEETLLLLMMEG